MISRYVAQCSIDSETITDNNQAKCLVELRKQVEGHPEYASFDGTGLCAGEAQIGTADTGFDNSGAAEDLGGTPGQPKLKLTFNNSLRDNADGSWPMNEDE